MLDMKPCLGDGRRSCSYVSSYQPSAAHALLSFLGRIEPSLFLVDHDFCCHDPTKRSFRRLPTARACRQLPTHLTTCPSWPRFFGDIQHNLGVKMHPQSLSDRSTLHPKQRSSREDILTAFCCRKPCGFRKIGCSIAKKRATWNHTIR